MDKAFRKKACHLHQPLPYASPFFHTHIQPLPTTLYGFRLINFSFLAFSTLAFFFFLLFQYYCTYFNGKLVMSPIQLETQQYFTDCIELFKIQSCKTVYPDNFRSWHIPLMLYRKLPYFHGQELSQFQIWSVPFR